MSCSQLAQGHCVQRCHAQASSDFPGPVEPVCLLCHQIPFLFPDFSSCASWSVGGTQRLSSCLPRCQGAACDRTGLGACVDPATVGQSAGLGRGAGLGLSSLFSILGVPVWCWLHPHVSHLLPKGDPLFPWEQEHELCWGAQSSAPLGSCSCVATRT